MVIIRARRARRVVHRYSPPDPPSHPHPGYTPSPPSKSAGLHAAGVPAVNMVVGLISVAQLSLGTLFSGSRTITEVYNLLEIDRINNHSLIPGND